MSIETAIEKLADAINNVAGVLAVIQGGGGEPATEAEAPKRGRPAKAKDEPTLQEKMQAVADKAKGETKEVVDAGTGEVVTVGAEPDIAALRLKAKDLGVKLISTQGEADVAGLLRKHSGITDEAENAGFSKVPNAAIPALIADFEALASMAD